MICVIIIADERDRFIRTTMASMLEQRFSVLHAWNGNLVANEKCAELVLADAGYRSVQADNTVLVFRDMAAALPDLPIQRAVAIVNSGDKELHDYVASTGIPAITCGLSAKDTITLSSMRTDSAVVNFQRTVTCFDASTAEPQEIPVKLTENADSFALMAAMAVCLLAGKPSVAGLCEMPQLEAKNCQ